MARRCDITFPDSYSGPAKRAIVTCETTQTDYGDIRQIEPDWVSLANVIRNKILQSYPSVKVYHVYVDDVGRTSRVTGNPRMGTERTIYTYKFEVNVEFHDSPIAAALLPAILTIIKLALITAFVISVVILAINVVDVFKQAEITKTVEQQKQKQIAETGQQILSNQGYDAYLKWLEAQTKLAEAQKTGQQLSDVEQAFQRAIFYIVLLAGIGIAIYVVYLLIERYAKK